MNGDTDGTSETEYDNSWEALLRFAEREAARRADDSLLAEDVAATVIKKLVAQGDAVVPEARRAWLRTAVRNEVTDRHRRAHVGTRDHRQLRNIEIPPDEDLAKKQIGSQRRWLVKSPSLEVMARQREQRVQSLAGHVFARLNERQKQLLLLSMDESLTHEQLAAELGYASADVVKVTLNRLRKRLRDEFGNEIGDLLRGEW